jgi:hypothetical protein
LETEVPWIGTARHGSVKGRGRPKRVRGIRLPPGATRQELEEARQKEEVWQRMSVFVDFNPISLISRKST